MAILRAPVMSVSIHYKNDTDDITVTTTQGGINLVWIDEKYRTLVFDESPTGDFLAWLEEFAAKQS